jgi:uncharacterized SAM-binding protein YcdF (DUF218 family)
MRPRRRWRIALRAIVLLAFAAWAASAGLVLLWSTRDDAHPAHAIVVLGAAQYVGRPSPVLRARLDHAIALFKKGLAPRLILTGGSGPGDTTSEAAVSRRYAIKHGVPDSAISVETEGHTSSESLRSAAGIMRARGLASAILVSDPFHMLRLRILARRFGITPYTSPTPTSPISANPAAVARYTLSESVKAPWAYVMER